VTVSAAVSRTVPGSLLGSFTDGFAMSGMNARVWRTATTDATYAVSQGTVRPLTARTTAQHQGIQAVKNVPAFKTPAAQGTKGSSPWRFPV
jgi:hypothetical protein